ncbi:thioredoxin family protein [Candidatus Woesebacteria bacterium]|nr:thioredoxin family protein [Candidatus Woesebacteria bacterium]
MKPPVIIGAIILILIIGVFAFQKSSPSLNTSETTISDTSQISQPSQTETSTNNPNTQKRYIEYSQSQFNELANTRRVIYFYAKWCSTCRPADANFTQNESKIPEDVTLIRVNFNDDDTDQSEKDLAKKYSVPYQHTFVQIDSNGNEVTRWVGGDIDELISNLK